jgi:hypothetical protein
LAPGTVNPPPKIRKTSIGIRKVPGLTCSRLLMSVGSNGTGKCMSGAVVGTLLRRRQAQWERCNAEVVQAGFA